MKTNEFQDMVLQHLGADGEYKKNLAEELRGLKEQVTKTNGTVRKHQSWIDNASGRMTVIASISVLIGGAIVNWILEILKGR